jgi:hypothetical protein
LILAKRQTLVKRQAVKLSFPSFQTLLASRKGTLLPQLSPDLLILVVKKDVSYATIILVCQTIGVTRLNTGIYLNAIA